MDLQDAKNEYEQAMKKGQKEYREQTEGVPRLRGRISLLFVPNPTFWGEKRKRLSKVHKKTVQSLAGTALTVPGR